MKSGLLFAALLAIICLSFAAFDNDENFNLNAWKTKWASLSEESRRDLTTKFTTWFRGAPKVLQDALVEDVVEVIVEDEVARVENDLAEEEFICGGICIGVGVAVAGGLAYFGHEKGKRDGFKAPAIHHYPRKDDDEFIGLLDKFVKAHDYAKDITYRLLADPRGGGRHVYVYNEDDASAEEINEPSFLAWTYSWNSFSKTQQQELFEEVKPVYESLNEEERALYNTRINKLVDYQHHLARVGDSDMAEEEFVCGGVCIAVAVGAGIGIFHGAHTAGKEKTQLHIHHRNK